MQARFKDKTLHKGIGKALGEDLKTKEEG